MALSPKCYFTYDADSEDVKKGTKGVPHSCDLVVKNFLNKLYGQTDHSVELRSLRILGGKMSRTIQERKSLSDLFAKFRVSDDRISCTPLTENNRYL